MHLPSARNKFDFAGADFAKNSRSVIDKKLNTRPFELNGAALAGRSFPPEASTARNSSSARSISAGFERR